ncbi:SDR family NAD(P)-dependent oxidoreductase [Diaphorobacter caeni]|uniref:SDR family NAD(P)-dependent oxidoreductase n=1 Tax=Diaphorobacter caeni TaxID=2784387 RepID=UPI00189050F2|nr:SDR family oxidoreductase [Diaphorobacter caeni]MBF5007266.1 SDR family oxidoreductase [Diaphorobacter caeni]
MENHNTSLAIITGGGTGLGLAAGLELRRRGWRVVALGLDTESELEGSGIEFQNADITDAHVFETLARQHPRVDMLINAAGVILHDEREFDMLGFRKVIDVNLLGTQLACVALRDSLARAGGSIVNYASMWSYFGSGRNPAYSASKGAVVSLTRSLAVAFAKHGVRVNAVAPGWIETRMSTNAFSDPERATPILQRIPAARWGKPVEVAKAVAFLGSADAAYITGVVLPVDGGYSVA